MTPPAETSEFCYEDKLVLAPMVRVGTLPMRLLSLQYGADIVYCEEIVDRSILRCKRTVNSALGCVDYCVDGEKYPVFRTCKREAGQVVFQVGTCSPDSARSVVKLVEQDVAAIDVNMGCPKAFSIQGGMGAALLDKPELIQEILTTMVQSTSKPITCKIRVLPDREKTLELARLIERCGVKALAVHGRTRDERPRHSNRNVIIRDISQALNIPVIANGGSSLVSCFEDISKFKVDTACSSVMLARAAMDSPSIFRHDGLLPLDDVIRDYLVYAIEYDNCPQNTKYTIQQMLKELQTNTERGQNLLKAPALRDICRVYDMEDSWLKQQARIRDRLMHCRTSVVNNRRTSDSWDNCQNGETAVLIIHDDKRIRDDVDHEFSNNSNTCSDPRESHVIQADVTFIRSYFGAETPKSILNALCVKRGLKPPSYATTQRPTDKKFQCKLTIPGLSERLFCSSYWEKNMRYAEQAAAIVAFHHLGMLGHLPKEYQELNYSS